MDAKKNYNSILGSNTIEKHQLERSVANKSEVELWKAFKDGDEGAFIEIYQKYFDLLVNYCFQFTQNKDLIKDCVQDLFIYLRNKRESVSITDNIKRYLLKSCRNRIMSYLKKDNHHASIDEIEKHLFVPIISFEENIINLQTRMIKEKRLNMSIQKLSAREREIIYYFYFQNMDYQSIAEIMGYEHVKSVRSLMYKALGKLKELIIVIVTAFIFTL